ncbi:MAG: hypothetical protein ACPGYL_07145, partial [Rhodospirillaceae bacterium]
MSTVGTAVGVAVGDRPRRDRVLEDRLDRATRYLIDGRLQEAWDDCAHILSVNPDHMGALRLSSLCALRGGETEIAESHAARAVSVAPDSALAWRTLSLCRKAKGDRDGEVEALEQAVALQPEFRAARLALGDGRLAMGDLSAAEGHYAALKGDAEALSRRVAVLNMMGRSAEVLHLIEDFHAAPDLTEAGQVGIQLCLEGAIALEALGKPEESEARLAPVLAVAPGHPVGLRLLSRIRAGLGDAAGARAALGPLVDHPLIALERAALPQPVPDDVQALADIRREILEVLDRLVAEQAVFPEPDGLAMVAGLSWLTVQGFEDSGFRDALSERLARLCPSLHGLEPWQPPRARSYSPLAGAGAGVGSAKSARTGTGTGTLTGTGAGTARRVAILASDWSTGGAGALMAETFAALRSSAKGLQFLLASPVPTLEGSAGGVALAGWEETLGIGPEERLHVPRKLEVARQQLRAAEIDIVILVEPVRDPLLWMLGQSRLAPAQWVWAPITGEGPGTAETVDGWILADALAASESTTSPTAGGASATANTKTQPESKASDQKASGNAGPQALVLPGFGLTGAVEKPPVADRAKLALPKDKTLYFCPTEADLLHPQADALLAEIARQDANGLICLFRASRQAVTEALARRLSRAGLPAKKILWLHRRARAVRLAAVAAADVVLDMPGRDMGLDALTILPLGVPVLAADFAALSGPTLQAYEERFL